MKRYLSSAEVAQYLGVTSGTLKRYKLPEPDATVGRARGWLPETIKAWNEQRPGRGNWGKQRQKEGPQGA